ncbi:MAG: hypothetical protein JO333_11915 [Verrucomicrobia bacterium]|nr:hypothetical protein [Verrucomicrobiota bacterium]
MLNRLRSFTVTVAVRVLTFVGRHPVTVLVLPSLWFLWQYLPFWKDIDATVQLVAPAYDDNILHFPPVYCFLARVPFFLTDLLLTGHAPQIFAGQNPSLTAVYSLVAIQHLLLWIALGYFIKSIPATALGRGVAAFLLASIASFYTFAHTCGSEAMTAVTYFFVFGAGMRMLRDRASCWTWAVYAVALFVSIGSRHINLVLLLWLPATAGLSLVWVWARGRRNKRVEPAESGPVVAAPNSECRRPEPITAGSQWLRSRALTALTALVLSFLAFGTERAVVQLLCARFAVVNRLSIGPSLSDRIASWVDPLAPPQKQMLLERTEKSTTDPLVKLAIRSQIETGAYYKGTDTVLEAALREKGFSGEALNVEKDRLTFQSALCFYRTGDPRFIKQVLIDFWRGFVPANDQGIAIAAPKATYFSLERITANPSDWTGISSLPIFTPAQAKGTADRAYNDNMIRHWRWVPILIWILVFLAIGIWRVRYRQLSGPMFATGLSMLGVGILIYAANCACASALPRYALPLLVSVIAFVAVTVTANEPE